MPKVSCIHLNRFYFPSFYVRSMWDKPRELTSYDSAGYEILAMGSSKFSSAVVQAIAQWSASSVHNAVILNLSPWSGLPWAALGCGMSQVGG